MMKYLKFAVCVILILGLSDLTFAKGPAKGYMGGSGVMVGGSGGGGGGGGDSGNDTDGPLNDNISTEGQLYGDLYKILRYRGGEDKNVPVFDAEGKFIEFVDGVAIGGEPILTEDFVEYDVIDEVTGEVTGTAIAPTPSLCVQPVADFHRWGDLSDVENAENWPEGFDSSTIEHNALPLIKTYDPTWDRTEFAVGIEEDPVWFIPPGGTWKDPINGIVTYDNGVLWTDLVEEVHFGRLNLARAPEAVLAHAFDEAISAINIAVEIGLDASGRLLLTKPVYSEYEVYTVTDLEKGEIAGEPVLIGYFEKAIDSPLENMALYLKLMKDGHLVTPGDERSAIDRSERGGIPINMMFEMEDGPSTALRPTVDIAKVRAAGLGFLVDVDEVTYYTYQEPVYETGTVVAVDLIVTLDEPDSSVDYEAWVGIPTNDRASPDSADFELCAAALAAAADKTGMITVDHIVYLNSILGLNKVVGTNEDETVDYTLYPQFYDFSGTAVYNRAAVVGSRPRLDDRNGGDPNPGVVPVLVATEFIVQNGSGDPVPGEEETISVWEPVPVTLFESVSFREWDQGEDRLPNLETATFDIGGFAQSTDDNLSIIEYVHTFQIPENR